MTKISFTWSKNQLILHRGMASHTLCLSFVFEMFKQQYSYSNYIYNIITQNIFNNFKIVHSKNQLVALIPQYLETLKFQGSIYILFQMAAFLGTPCIIGLFGGGSSTNCMTQGGVRYWDQGWVSIGPSNQLQYPVITEVVSQKIPEISQLPGTKITEKLPENVQQYHFQHEILNNFHRGDIP